MHGDALEGFRLSPQQRHVWALSREPAGDGYRCRGLVRIEGDLDIAALERALGQAVSRHEILRTTFRSFPGVVLPVQVVHEPAEVSVVRADVADLDPDGRRDYVESWWCGEPAGFDLEIGPLLHAELVSISPACHLLCLELPALCGDARSLDLIVEEVAVALAAADGDGGEVLQYADLAEWQNELLEADDTQAGRDYWRRREELLARSAALPYGRRPLDDVFRPAACRVPREAIRGVAAPAGERGLTLEDWVLAVWCVLLGRLTGDRDLVIGLAADGREYDGLDGALGPFARFLPLEAGQDPATPLGEVAVRLRDSAADARRFQEYFSWDGLDASEQGPGYLKLAFEGRSLAGARNRAGISIRLERAEACVDRFCLKLVCVEGAGDVPESVELHYDASVFDAASVDRLSRQLVAALRDSVENPGRAASDVVILDDEAWREIVEDFAVARSGLTAATPVHEMFATQVRSTPDRVAVVHEDERLTYRALDHRANALAAVLAAQGVGPDTPVALCVERSLEFIVALLGVLKSGGAYAPLDPGQPPRRMRRMLDDLAPAAVVTAGQAAKAVADLDLPVIRLDQLENDPAPKVPASGVEPGHLAYVMFTSGSTGRPKGVGVEHRQVANYVRAITDRFDLPDGASYAMISTVAADLGNTAVFPALCGGGTLHVVSEACSFDGKALAGSVARQPFDLLKIVPSHLAALAMTAPLERLAPRRLLVLGGEAADVELIEAFRSAAPGVTVVNHYGPTESTVGMLTCNVGDAAEGDRPPPLGRPIANTEAFVLDDRLAPVSVGVWGELCIGGACVARGYAGAPAATAERFIPHPFAASSGARLYRTGDRCRFLDDGNVEFGGRLDRQVKIRGYRIEPAEAAASIAEHPAVRQAVVTVLQDPSGDARLAAYVVPESPADDLDVHALRGWLQERLPEYMIPAAWVTLDALPLTPNGKIDHAALPLPRPDRGNLGTSYVAARTPVEAELSRIWSDVLGIERIGVHDDFFELGGHSLLATQMIARARQALRTELPLLTIFEQPTIAGLAATIDVGAAGEEAPPIVPVSRDCDLPLSFPQLRLWFLDQLVPGNAFYNEPWRVRLGGRLAVDSLRRTFEEILRRHEVLRTGFAVAAGGPVQVVRDRVALPFPVVDLSGLDEDARSTEADRLASADAQMSFDLESPPLLRTYLLRLAADDHTMLLTMHHIVSDLWSIGVLVREIAVLYEVYSRGGVSPLPELPVQYADFAAWQRKRFQGETLERELDYWREQLKDLPTLELPTDRPHEAVQTFRGDSYGFELPAALVGGLQELGNRERVTLFMTLLGAFKTLLRGYTGQDDVVVATPIANRTRPEIEPLIGFFLNSLVLRTDLGGDPTFGELLGRVRRTALDAYAHQDLPFEKLVEELQPDRDLSREPLFQVMLVLQNAPMPAFDIPAGLSIRPVESNRGTAKFDLTLVVWAGQAGGGGILQYSTDLFDRTTVERFGGHLTTLLRGIVDDPQRRLSELPLMSEAEIRQVVVDWNATARPYPAEAIPALFEAQVARAPGAPAVVDGEATWSYVDLNRRANRTAHRLMRLGVGAGVPVGVLAGRSATMVAGLLGVTKSGGAYVPLDPEYPAQRLRFMLDDASVPVLLARRDLAERVPEFDGAIVWLDDDLQHEPDTDPRVAVGPDDLAYVTYTSGSTGRPKGVEVVHRGVARLVFDGGYAALGPDEALLHLSSPTFDASTFEIWGALLHGGRCVIHRERVPTAGGLREAIERHAVKTLWVTTALFNTLMDQDPDLVTRVDRVLTGGEVASPDHFRKGLDAPAGAELVNMYGPTENTTFTTFDEVRSGETWHVPLPIGRPISNTRVHLLDRDLRSVPVGVRGELWVGGDGLARGYLGRPALTAECFVPDPFSTVAGARLYRTGDAARYLADGRIEFLGRLDDQLKLRGFRIEPGEIEAKLAQHPDVLRSAVVPRRAAAGDPMLVAYVVLGEGANPERLEERLRLHLGVSLPEYMIPALFVPLDELPLTPAGKLDRRALPELSAGRPQRAGEYVAPRNAIEEELARIWAEVLRVDPVGVHDDFFLLGGHSLLATQLASRVRASFGVELPLGELFRVSTVAGLADAIRSTEARDEAPPIVPVDRSRPLPLSYAQQRLWFLDRLVPGNAFYNMSVAMRLVGDLDVTALVRTFDEIVRRHEILRTTFEMVDGQAVQVVGAAQGREVPVIDLGDRPVEEREAAIEHQIVEGARLPFDLEQGPLLRIVLLRLGELEHAVLFAMHHIVSDGWSMGVLAREVGVLYEAFSRGWVSPLGELPIQYADFACWQRDWLQGEVLERQLSYWRDQLAGVEPLRLPTDRPRPAMQTFHGANHAFGFSAELSSGIREAAVRQGTTLFMTLLAAFNALLCRYTGQGDVAVGSGIANRNRAEIEGLIGFFVNMLVLRTRCGDDPEFDELVRRTRQVCLDAYAHQDLPFEKLVDELQPDRDLAREPLFQVVFVVQNMPLPSLTLPGGLSLQPIPTVGQTAKYDLSFFLWERPDRIGGHVEYSTDLFDGATIERMTGHLGRLLEAVVADPTARLSSLPLLSEPERSQLIVEWNDTDRGWPESPWAHEMFEAHARRNPRVTALIDSAGARTYGELDAAAARIAARLIHEGVGPESLVAIVASRSPRTFEAILGVHKAGAAFVPLDPAYPAARLQFMLEDCGARVLLAEGEPPQGLRSVETVVDLEGRLPQPEAAGTHPRPAGDHPAYVIYTSGSTGSPKGVSVRYAGLASLARALGEVFQLGSEDRVLQFSSTSFDASVWETFMALTSGAALCLGRQDELRSTPELASLLRRLRVTVATLPPTVLGALSAEGLDHLRTVVSAGEACSEALVRRWSPGRRFINAYGPTEMTVCATLGECSPDRRPTIGGPIPGARAYVLDRELNPLPASVPGELCTSGPGIARGYHGRPELTAERFVPDPFSREPGGRLYRSGDSCRWTADGQLEFLGRIDHQVKIRGFRIETGEIESALVAHPGVGEAVVVALPGDGSAEHQRLVAYVVPDLSATLAPERRRRLRQARVDEWCKLNDETYAPSPTDPTLDLAGWKSSYTGEALGQDEMLEWVDETVARIRALNPRRVLEIGCGTGLLLFRIAPDCDRYVGTDIARPVVDRVNAHAREMRLGQVEVHCRAAHDRGDHEPGSFDTVLLNSVAQYFPDVDYLLDVLRQAVAATRPGGRVFVGDVRSLCLLRAFHASVLLEQAPASRSRADLARELDLRVRRDRELAMDPRLFRQLVRSEPRVTAAEILVKRGRADNEMTGFRYDVVLHVEGSSTAEPQCAELDWSRDGLSMAALRQRIEQARGGALVVRNLPDARVASAGRALALIEEAPSDRSAEDMRAHLDGRLDGSVHPEDLWRLADELSCVVSIGPEENGDPSTLRMVVGGAPGQVVPRDDARQAEELPWADLANDPVAAGGDRGLAPELRDWLGARLPDHMVPASIVVLETFPLTPGGKVDRRALPAAGAVRPDIRQAYVPPAAGTEESLADIWRRTLGVDRVGARDNFFDLGGDSILAIQVVARAAGQGIHVTPRLVFEHQTVRELAAAAASAAEPAAPTAGEVAGPFPMTPIQRWFFEQRMEEAHHFNQTALFELRQRLDYPALRDAVAALFAQHDILRARFSDMQAEIVELDGRQVEEACDHVDLSGCADADLVEAIESRTGRIQRSLDLASGPLIRFVYFDLGTERNDRLLVTAHHIAVDPVSWKTLFDDLYGNYVELARTGAVARPAPATSFRAWAERLDGYRRSRELQDELAFWEGRLPQQLEPLPVDRCDGDNVTASEADLSVTLDEDVTRTLLTDLARRLDVRADAVLLGALSRVLAGWSGANRALVEIQSHGRQSLSGEVDLTRTVGWFTSLFPLMLEHRGEETLTESVARVARDLRAAPRGGIGYGLLRYSASRDVAERLRRLPAAELSFNYRGRRPGRQAGGALGPAPESPGPARSGRALRPHRLLINADVVDGRLTLSFKYSENLHDRSTIERLAGEYVETLRELARAPGRRPEAR